MNTSVQSGVSFDFVRSHALRLALFISLILFPYAPALRATCGGGGGGGGGGTGDGGWDTPQQTYQVPWKVLQSDNAPPATSSLIIYWFPASAKEVKNSSLRTSRYLALNSDRCIAMFIATSDTPLGKQLNPDAAAPIALLTDGDGKVIARADGKNGKLQASAVEKILRDELRRRDDELSQRLAEAKAKAKAGDKTSAIEIYKSVWGSRCLLPDRGDDAAHALKKLGAPVPDKQTSEVTPVSRPILDGPVADEVVSTMQEGFTAEIQARYDDAVRLYTRAHELDPGDATPARYLGEVYRHDTGEWDKARLVFEEILAQHNDPLARAVALQGLGKMTIHEGHFVQGLHLIEESTQAFPLALAYRNLAVFWNSECDPVKTAHYVALALQLDPDDSYNRVFAAVFMSASGHKEEALRIANEHESLLAASYNLAGIHAQAGDKEKALALLKRHFFEYERYQAVRAEEMMEARVDEVFVTLRNDPRFLALTADADGKLAMPTAH